MDKVSIDDLVVCTDCSAFADTGTEKIIFFKLLNFLFIFVFSRPHSFIGWVLKHSFQLKSIRAIIFLILGPEDEIAQINNKLGFSYDGTIDCAQISILQSKLILEWF
jgi:hypothetical protein